MSLDQNLFTLHFKPNEKDTNVLDLIDPSGTVHYRKRRVRDLNGGNATSLGTGTGTGTGSGTGQGAQAAGAPGTYKIEVYDPMSESLLVTASALAASSKVKTLELCNPTQVVELKSTGTLSFRWAFKWEDDQFEWKKDGCYMIRKPDPPVVVAVTRDIPASKGVKTTSVQILDYNLNRFDIEDRKGLEIVILTSLMTFQDTDAPATETPPAPAGAAGVLGLSMPSMRRDNTASSASGASVASNLSASTNTGAKAPTPPPKPAPKTGVDKIAEMQAMKEEINVITIDEEGEVEDYAQYCCQLLGDDAMLFITVRSAAAEQVPKVLQVVEETRRQRHKSGLDEEEQLHQYVLYDTVPTQKGPKRINLDDDDKKNKQKYVPPNSLTVHLSKIPMPELQPKASNAGHLNSHKKDKKDDKYATKPAPKPSSSSKSSSRPHKSNRPGNDTPPHIHSHQVHPNQPSPSPSQLNNPGIYAAPPPPVNHGSRPHNNSSHAPSGSGGWNATSFYPGSAVGNSYAAPFQPPYSGGGSGYGPPPGPPPRHPSYAPPFGHPPPPPGASGPLPPHIGHPPPPPGQGALNAGSGNGNGEPSLTHKPSGLFGFLRR